jgi:hypothetical protein
LKKQKEEVTNIEAESYDANSNSVQEKSEDLIHSDLKRSLSYEEQIQKVKMVRQRSR